eukprot:1193578-Prorocentrum_minimum.AAC.6
MRSAGAPWCAPMALPAFGKGAPPVLTIYEEVIKRTATTLSTFRGGEASPSVLALSQPSSQRGWRKGTIYLSVECGSTAMEGGRASSPFQ